MKFRYETHCHTSEVSRCGKLSAAEIVRLYKKLDYTGIFVTDHFMNGNSYVNTASMAWEERVAGYCKGFDAAYEEGQRVGLDVLFAWEYTYKGTDYLTYGLDREWLYAHPDVCDWTPNQYFDKVREDGAFVVHAHPMRQAGYIPMICLFPDKVDAVEVDNASMLDIVNERGNWYADSYGLLKTAGSDTHSIHNRRRLAGIDANRRILTPADYGDIIRSGDYSLFSLPVTGTELDNVQA